MQYGNTHRGLKKVYTSEVLSLISIIGVALVTAIGLASFGGNYNATTRTIDIPADGAGTGTILIIGGVALCAAVLLIVALIMQLVGLNQLKVQNKPFRWAFNLAIISLIVGFVSGLLSSVESMKFVAGLADICSDFFEILITIFVIKGIMELAAVMGEDKMVKKGQHVYNVILALLVISIALNVVAGFIQNSEAMLVVAGVLSIVGSILSIVAVLMYLSYLSRSVKMTANR